MPAFSITAPRFTQEDEERELADLTASDRDEIDVDLHGIRDFLPEGDDVTEAQIEDFYRAIGQVPVEERTAYIRAREVCPFVVATESDPSRFLRCNDYDPDRAAKQMAVYWEKREEFFGEKAFFPMTLTGAMSDETEHLLQIPCWMRILPSDERGRTVICIDRENGDMNQYPRMTIVRIWWYIFHVALEQKSTQTKGVVMLFVFKRSQLQNFDRIRGKKLFASIKQCLPISIKALHIVSTAPVVLMVLPAVKFFMNPYLRQRLQVHSGKASETLDSLKEFGLDKRKLPLSVSGTFSRDLMWLQRRMEIEDDVNSPISRMSETVFN